MITNLETPTKKYKFVPLKVKPETHQKVRIAAALAGLPIHVWIDLMAETALGANAERPVATKQEQS